MLKDRVSARLKALGINQFEAVEGTPLSRYFVYDIMAEKKEEVRLKNMPDLARALRCSVDYLLEKTDEIGTPPFDTPIIDVRRVVPTAGIIDAQTWRLESAGPIDALNLPPLPQYAASRQVVFLFRGEAFEQVRDGMFVIAVVAEDYARNHGVIGPGTPVIIERRRQMDGQTFVQTVVRKLSISAADRALAKHLDQKSSVSDEGRIIAVPVLAMQPI